MEIIIRNSAGTPLYEQIAAQIRTRILSGELKSGEALPSIRTLARDLKLSVITTKRAYDELEAAGLVNTVAGKGCFVAEELPQALREETNRELETYLLSAVRLAKDNAIPYEEFLNITEILWKEEP